MTGIPLVHGRHGSLAIPTTRNLTLTPSEFA
jgi:hypothetical protein